MHRFFRDPLFRFCLIGLAIFVLYAWWQPPGGDSGDHIEVSQSRIDAWRGQYRKDHGRLPSAEEQQHQIGLWVDEEVLYRQALRLGLHQNDSIVRRQLIQKMGFVIEGATPLPPPSDAELQAFLDADPERYGHAPAVSLEQVFLSRGRHGSQLQSQAEQTLAQLQQAPDDYVGLGDSFITGQRIAAQNERQLRADFGKSFVEQIRSLPAGQWQGPIESGFGLHLVRITERMPFRAAQLGEVRRQVEVDYRLHRQALARREALDALRREFVLKIGDQDAATMDGGQTG